MNLHPGDEYGTGEWNASKVVGVFLVILAAGVIFWTVVQIFQLFTQGSAFITLDGIVPQRIVISETSDSSFVLPRELLIYGLPIWALSVTTKIGVMLMKSGLQYVELPRRKGSN
jgi:hypothetical protein